MDDRSSHSGSNARSSGLRDRVEEAASGLNAVLLVLAIGLAVLDLTCFVGVEVRDALPAATTAAGPH